MILVHTPRDMLEYLTHVIHGMPLLKGKILESEYITSERNESVVSI